MVLVFPKYDEVNMKKIIVTKINGETESFSSDNQDKIDEWKNYWISVNAWGKPERWLAQSYMEEYEKLITPLDQREVEIVKMSGSYIETEYLLPADYSIEILDITEQVNQEKDLQEKIAEGKILKACCEDVLAFVTGYNRARKLSSDQVTQMQITFQNIFSLLIANRADTAKLLIGAVEVDGVVVTQDLKDKCLMIFQRYGI